MREARRRAPKTRLTFDDAAKLARKLPGVTESTSYGTRALKVDGKLFARLKEDGETLVLKVDLTSRDFLLRDEPGVFFLTDHYRDYPYVLPRLPAATAARLEELLEDAWRLAAPRKRLAQLR
jgi:hypothetical protein